MFISRLNVNMYNIYIDKSIYQIIYFQHICIFADELKITHMDLCIDSFSYKKMDFHYYLELQQMSRFCLFNCQDIWAING